MRLTGASCREAWERTAREAWRSVAKFGRSSFWISSLTYLWNALKVVSVTCFHTERRGGFSATKKLC